MSSLLDRICALSVVIRDSLDVALEEVVGLGGSGPAALMSIDQEAGITVDELALTVGITGSGAVRLVDRLQAGGLVERHPGADGRTRLLRLTAEGERLADAAFAARNAELERILGSLDVAERETLGRLAGKLLAAAVADPVAANRACRLCSVESCPDPVCPLAALHHAGAGPDRHSAAR